MAGNKLKTNRSAAKRIKVTGTGKLAHSKSYKNHLLTNKGNATKKEKMGQVLDKVEVKRIASLIPYKMR